MVGTPSFRTPNPQGAHARLRTLPEQGLGTQQQVRRPTVVETWRGYGWCSSQGCSRCWPGGLWLLRRSGARHVPQGRLDHDGAVLRLRAATASSTRLRLRRRQVSSHDQKSARSRERRAARHAHHPRDRSRTTTVSARPSRAAGASLGPRSPSRIHRSLAASCSCTWTQLTTDSGDRSSLHLREATDHRRPQPSIRLTRDRPSARRAA
jgi:hypothetical protein